MIPHDIFGIVKRGGVGVGISVDTGGPEFEGVKGGRVGGWTENDVVVIFRLVERGGG